jgi:quercetin dioxygenase-like cupin family protein
MKESEESLRQRLGSLIGLGGIRPVKSSGDARMFASDPIKFVPKGWGYEKWIANCPEYCGKLLFIAKGRKCSFHYHELKDEVFYVQKGAIEMYYSFQNNLETADMKILVEGDKMHIPTGMRHQFVALKDTELFEFSTTHFEEDSYRLEKGD